MADSVSSSSFILSVLFDDTIVLKIDILFLFSIILTTIYCIGLFRWIQKVDNCLFFKAVARIVAACFNFARLEDNSSQNNSTSSAQNNDAASYNDNYHTDDNHINRGVVTSTWCLACETASHMTRHVSPSGVESISTDPSTRDIVHGPENLSNAKGALLSVAGDLEFDVANLTRNEAGDMLVELQTLRSTIGSRVPLFTQQNNSLVDAFGPDAWYGETCLIDALMWLLKRRFPDCGEAQLQFSGFGENKENGEQSRIEQIDEDENQGDEATHQKNQEQEKQRVRQESTLSSGPSTTHIDSAATKDFVLRLPLSRF